MDVRGVLLARGADAPVGHLGLVDDEAVGVARFQARSRAGCAVDVRDIATCSAYRVVVVVAHPRLEAGGGAGGLDPADQLGVRPGTQDVVDALRGYRAKAGADLGRQGAHVGVRVCVHLDQHGDPWTGDTQGDLSLIHISEPTRRTPISYAVFCLKKKKNTEP